MRVAYVLPYPELGGGAKVVFQHARLLAERGWSPTVLAEGPRPDWAPRDLPYRDWTAGAAGLPGQDLVIATFWTTFAVARRLGLGPLAHFCQGYEGGLAHLRPMLPEIERAYGEPLPALTVTPHLAAFLAERFGRESRVVPPPLDPLFAPRPRLGPRRVPWIAVAGIFEAEVKGVATALRAVARLRQEGLACHLLRLSLLPLTAAERALAAPDLYLCAVPPAAAARAIRRSDLLLFPSRAEEGFGLPLLEALGAKVPAVACRIPSVEFMAGAARLVPVGDDAAMAGAARELLLDAAAWRRARRAGYEASRRFLPARVGEELVEAIEWAVAASSPHPLGPPLPVTPPPAPGEGEASNLEKRSGRGEIARAAFPSPAPGEGPGVRAPARIEARPRGELPRHRMTPMLPELSVVIPAYNEAKRLGPSLDKAVAYLERRGEPFEIVVADDGSRDSTPAVARGRGDARIRVVGLPQNRGKGAAVKQGILASRGRKVLISDADFSTPIEEVEKLEAHLDRAPLVLGSRAVADSDVRVRQPFYRELMGKTFNLIVRLVGVRGIRDTQCGFKLAEGGVARQIAALLTVDKFAYDVELVWLARRLGHRVAEVGVVWEDSRDSRVSPVSSSAAAFWDVLRFRFRHRGRR